METKKIDLGYVSIAGWNPSVGCYDYSSPDNVKLDPNEQILNPNLEYTLIIYYPVTVPYIVDINTGESGMTRIEMIELACKHYQKMYDEEDESSSTGDPGHITGMLNRNFSDGKYGIWGHDIGDLILHTLKIDESRKELTLGVDS